MILNNFEKLIKPYIANLKWMSIVCGFGYPYKYLKPISVFYSKKIIYLVFWDNKTTNE